jgi:hypothetical protein
VPYICATESSGGEIRGEAIVASMIKKRSQLNQAEDLWTSTSTREVCKKCDQLRSLLGLLVASSSRPLLLPTSTVKNPENDPVGVDLEESTYFKFGINNLEYATFPPSRDLSGSRLLCVSTAPKA